MNEQEIIQPENTIARLVRVNYERNGWKMNRMLWENPSPDERLIRLGDRVWPASEDEKAAFVVKEIKQPGEKYYPEGGVICSSSGADRIFFMDAVIRHPAGVKKSKKSK